jgi:hypothetical protein
MSPLSEEKLVSVLAEIQSDIRQIIRPARTANASEAARESDSAVL